MHTHHVQPVMLKHQKGITEVIHGIGTKQVLFIMETIM